MQSGIGPCALQEFRNGGLGISRSQAGNGRGRLSPEDTGFVRGQHDHIRSSGGSAILILDDPRACGLTRPAKEISRETLLHDAARVELIGSVGDDFLILYFRKIGVLFKVSFEGRKESIRLCRTGGGRSESFVIHGPLEEVSPGPQPGKSDSVRIRAAIRENRFTVSLTDFAGSCSKAGKFPLPASGRTIRLHSRRDSLMVAALTLMTLFRADITILRSRIRPGICLIRGPFRGGLAGFRRL